MLKRSFTFRHVMRLWIRKELFKIYLWKTRIHGCIFYAANKKAAGAINLRITCFHLGFHNPVYFWLSSQVQLSEKRDGRGEERKRGSRRKERWWLKAQPKTQTPNDCHAKLHFMLANILLQSCSWLKTLSEPLTSAAVASAAAVAGPHPLPSHLPTYLPAAQPPTFPQAPCTPLTLAVSLTSDGETWKCAWGRGMQTKCKVLTAIERSTEHGAWNMEYSKYPYRMD